MVALTVKRSLQESGRPPGRMSGARTPRGRTTSRQAVAAVQAVHAGAWRCPTVFGRAGYRHRGKRCGRPWLPRRLYRGADEWHRTAEVRPSIARGGSGPASGHARPPRPGVWMAIGEPSWLLARITDVVSGERVHGRR